MKLTDAEVQEFFDRGWVVVPALFSTAEMTRAREAFERLYATAQKLRATQNHAGAYFVLDAPMQGDVIVKRVVWAGGAESTLLDLSADSRLVGPALQLLVAIIVSSCCVRPILKCRAMVSLSIGIKTSNTATKGLGPGKI